MDNEKYTRIKKEAKTLMNLLSDDERIEITKQDINVIKIYNNITIKAEENNTYDFLKMKMDTLVKIINKSANKEFDIISQNLTKDEMITIIENDISDYGGFYLCPESYNLKNNINYCYNDNCKACWLNAIKDIKFKGDKNE